MTKIFASLTVCAVLFAAAAAQATLIRLDLAGGASAAPSAGYIETKAKLADPAFGSLGANNWQALQADGGTHILAATDMPNTDGSASTVDISWTGVKNDGGGMGDWRGDNANTNIANLVWSYLSNDNNSVYGTMTISGLLPDTETKLWFISFDKPGSKITFVQSAVLSNQDGPNSGNWSTALGHDLAWNSSGYPWNPGNVDASKSVSTPNQGMGYMYTVTSSGTGTIEATINLDGLRMGGMQIAQTVPEPGTVALLGTGLLGLAAYGLRRRRA